MRFLPDHVRCHGLGCTVRHTCQRFLELSTGGPRTPYMSTTADIIAKRPCRDRLPAVPDAPEAA